MGELRIEHLFTEYADDIHKFMVYFTRNKDVDDLVQDTFMMALRSLDQYRGDGNPRTWILMIARSVAIDHIRKSKREQSVGGVLLSLLASSCQSPEDTVEFRDFRNRLLSILQSDRFKSNYRDVVICRAVMDMSVEDTARVLGWTSTRVNVTLHRALKVVRSILETMNGGAPLELANR